jgi:hypothetical protein
LAGNAAIRAAIIKAVPRLVGGNRRDRFALEKADLPPVELVIGIRRLGDPAKRMKSALFGIGADMASSPTTVSFWAFGLFWFEESSSTTGGNFPYSW